MTNDDMINDGGASDASPELVKDDAQAEAAQPIALDVEDRSGEDGEAELPDGTQPPQAIRAAEEVELLLIAPFDYASRQAYERFSSRIIDPAIKQAEKRLRRPVRMAVLNPLVHGRGLDFEVAYRMLHMARVVIADVTGCDHRVLSFLSMRQALSAGPAIPFTRDHSRTSYPNNVDALVLNAVTEEGEANVQAVMTRETVAALERDGAASAYCSHVHANLEPLRVDLRGSFRQSDRKPDLSEQYRLRNGGPTISIAVGDIRRVHGVDVWVNPENTHMEMARVFDSSISGTIRHMSSEWSVKGERSDDFIRRKLAEAMPAATLPAGTALMTPCSGELRREHGVKRVVHVAAVEIDGDAPGCGYRSISDVGICLSNALMTVDQHNGKWLGKGRNSLRSVICPLLGVSTSPGQAMANVRSMIRHMVEYFEAFPRSRIRDVSLLAYTLEDHRLLLQAIAQSNALIPVDPDQDMEMRAGEA